MIVVVVSIELQWVRCRKRGRETVHRQAEVGASKQNDDGGAMLLTSTSENFAPQASMDAFAPKSLTIVTRSGTADLIKAVNVDVDTFISKGNQKKRKSAKRKDMI